MAVFCRMDANLFSRTANSAVDYEAVGIDASWLLINGLDAGCMRRFGDCISLSDWVTKLGLEQSIARKIGLSGRDFMSLGWDYSSLIKSLDFTPRQVRKRHFLSHLYIKKMMFYQDRLGTNIGKTQKRMAFPYSSRPSVWKRLASIRDSPQEKRANPLTWRGRSSIRRNGRVKLC
jgi:hypothetical protein